MFVLQFVFDKINVCPFRVMTCQEKQVKTSLAFPLTSKKRWWCDGFPWFDSWSFELPRNKQTNAVVKFQTYMTAHTSLSFLLGILVPSFVPPRHVQKYVERFPPQTSGSPFFRAGMGPSSSRSNVAITCSKPRKSKLFPNNFMANHLEKNVGHHAMGHSRIETNG